MKWKAFTNFVACFALLASCFAFGSEKRIKFQQLPPAVQKTAKAESQGAKVRGYTTEVENGKTEYEVELIANGKTKDVSMDESGKVIETEQQVSLDQVPDKARDAIQKQAASGKILKVEKVTGSGPTVYEAQVKTGTKHSEIRVNENGEAAPED